MRICDAVARGHPALEGHFPGNPIVPGVLLLSRVLHAAEGVFKAKIGAVTSARFQVPLKPEQHFEIVFSEPAEKRVRFRVLRGEIQIANGVLELAAPPRVGGNA
jgi:3-hydroxymyristoyl/3-hydroxydecanoyl-(acyl carrier protein) dehydratase